MFSGQIGNVILKTDDGFLRTCHDTVTNSFSLGLRTINGLEWKYISKELHDLMVAELRDQSGLGL